MTTLTQGTEQLEWLLTDSGARSRESAIVTVAATTALPTGQVLGKLSATGKYVAYNNAGSGGAEVAAGILAEACPGTNGDYKRMVIDMDAEVIGAKLTGLDVAGTADLLARGIKVR